MNILLATNNGHKKKELAAILLHHTILTPGDLGFDFDYEETGSSFVENALGKAMALVKARRANPHPAEVVIADDSGLCVDALEGGPGIYSARYGSPDGGKTELAAAERNDLLLDSLKGVKDRTAHFVCTMVAVWKGNRFTIVQETWDGRIADRPSAGTGGFGYDPVFYVPELGCTAAELSEERKNLYSHRGRAARVLAASLEATLDLGRPEGR